MRLFPRNYWVWPASIFSTLVFVSFWEFYASLPFIAVSSDEQAVSLGPIARILIEPLGVAFINEYALGFAGIFASLAIISFQQMNRWVLQDQISQLQEKNAFLTEKVSSTKLTLTNALLEDPERDTVSLRPLTNIFPDAIPELVKKQEEEQDPLKDAMPNPEPVITD